MHFIIIALFLFLAGLWGIGRMEMNQIDKDLRELRDKRQSREMVHLLMDKASGRFSQEHFLKSENVIASLNAQIDNLKNKRRRYERWWFIAWARPK